MVLPKLVYVSDSTELGTIYVKKELEALRAVCDEAETLTPANVWPFPTYGDLLFSV